MISLLEPDILVNFSNFFAILAKVIAKNFIFCNKMFLQSLCFLVIFEKVLFTIPHFHMDFHFFNFF